ncbi:chemotaxis protein CheW [Desulfuribacillus alkaliarsenatis]|uniref:CheW-like domain-containing protein n=1 Tax=Desulfuribacillus alkaliarsenatis TaxID=766136 RepID=A0A1E5G102_9FIRM|nr:chemotaxis protein CheW [Desulfuribacillus alkaliarsenatis]OEF96586.1 hypothetical protein BHF68_08035 [Desulfuribacillus alkaliarsenatis]
MEKGTTATQFVTFQIGDEEYGVSIMLVQEIIRHQKLTKVFNANHAIRGVINFRGNVIPVVDMRRKFQLEEIDYDNHTVVIVLEVNKKTMGIIVERVSDIVNFTEDILQDIDQEFAGDVMTSHIRAMAKYDNRIIMLLDPDKIMSFEEYNKIKKSNDVLQEAN